MNSFVNLSPEEMDQRWLITFSASGINNVIINQLRVSSYWLRVLLLSYRFTKSFQNPSGFVSFSIVNSSLSIVSVENIGVEPMTSCLQSRRSSQLS
jgi:hypothetical protein